MCNQFLTASFNLYLRLKVENSLLLVGQAVMIFQMAFYAQITGKKKAKELERQGKYGFRVKDISWWKEELPTEEEK